MTKTKPMVLHLKEGLTVSSSLKIHFRDRLVFVIIDTLFQADIDHTMHIQMYVYKSNIISIAEFLLKKIKH